MLRARHQPARGRVVRYRRPHLEYLLYPRMMLLGRKKRSQAPSTHFILLTGRLGRPRTASQEGNRRISMQVPLSIHHDNSLIGRYKVIGSENNIPGIPSSHELGLIWPNRNRAPTQHLDPVKRAPLLIKHMFLIILLIRLFLSAWDIPRMGDRADCPSRSASFRRMSATSASMRALRCSLVVAFFLMLSVRT